LRRIPLAKPFFSEKEVEAVRRTLQSGWVAQGPQVKELEERISSYCGAKYGIAVNSCTSGLHLALLAHGISEGDKVIVPDFTFTATGNVVLHVGAIPELVDIELDTFCINTEKIIDKIDESVKAIIPVHAFGHPANIKEINKIAKDHNIAVIEDAALALGSELDGKKIGSYGNITCFSLQGRKVITTGEGGIVLVDDEELSEYMRALRSQGAFLEKNSKKIPIFRKVGFSYRLSDIQASIGLIQMDRIEEFIKRRIYLANYYNDLIEDTKLDVQFVRIGKNIRNNYQTYVILLKPNLRDKVILKLKEKGIETTIGTYSLSAQPLFRKVKREFPNSRYAFEHTLALPMYHELTENDIEYIINNLKSLLG